MEEATQSAGGHGGSAVWPSTVTSAALVAQLVAGKATRDALFLTHFDLKLLPAAMIGAAVLSAASVVLIARALSRAGPARVVPAAFALSAVLFLCEWSLSLTSERTTAIAVYAHTAIFGTAIGSAFWSLVNERFDPHEAKRLVGRIASGGTVGGVIGGTLVWGASSRLSVPMMLALLATMSVVGLWGSLRAGAGPGVKRTAKRDAVPPSQDAKVLGAAPYLRDLALLVGALAILQALLDWLLSQQASREFGQGPRLLGFFALFNMIVGVLSFIAQTGLTRWVLEKRGLGGTIRVQPVAVGVTAIVALLAGPGMLFAAVIGVRVTESVTRSSLFRSAYELFYTPLPPAKKRATKTFIDVGVDRVGTAVGSGVLFAVAHLVDETLQTRIVLFCVLGASVAAWLIAARLQDGYIQALASSLKSGALALREDDTEDLTTRKTLAETTALLDRDKLLARIEEFQRHKETVGEPAPKSNVSVTPLSERASTTDVERLVDSDPIVARAAALRSAEPAAIKRALASAIPPTLTAFVVPLLANDAVVRDVVRALRKVAPSVTGLLVDHLLDVEVDPRVRRRIPRILKVCRTPRAVHGLVLALRDPVFEVRVQIGIALAQMLEARAGASTPDLAVNRAEIFEIVVHELTIGRSDWSFTDAPLGRAPPASQMSDAGADVRRGIAHVFTVLGLVLEREPLSIAHRALTAASGPDAQRNPALRGTAFEYLEVILPSHIRGLLLPLMADSPPSFSEGPKSRRGSNELADELLRSRSGSAD